MASTRNSSANSARASTTFASTAPAASARARISSHGSSACWPTSTASATTSAPHSSWIHFTATDVSSPPEYASTTRFAITSASPDDSQALPELDSQTRQRGKLGGDGSAAGGFGAHDQDGVVTGNGAQDVGEPGAVDRAADDVGGARWRAQHDEVAALRDLHDELADDAPEMVVRDRPLLGVLGNRVGHGTTGDPDLHRAELLEVAADRGLGRDDAVGRQHLDQLRLARDRLLLEQPGDAVLPLRLPQRRHLRLGRLPIRTGGPVVPGLHGASTRNARTARVASRRFPACCHTALRGPSTTSSVTSSP